MLKDKNNYMDLRDTARLNGDTIAKSARASSSRETCRWNNVGSRLTERFPPTCTKRSLLHRYRAVAANQSRHDGRSARQSGEPLWKTNLDMSKVDEIGFSDLMAGAARHSGKRRCDWIEVYGNL